MKKTGILCASDEELAPFIEHIKKPLIMKKSMLTFYEGIIYDVPVVAAYSGVCKVNAAIAAQIMIDIFDVDIIINAGTAGGMRKDIQLFDTIIATEVAYHDVEDDILTEYHPWLPTIYFPVHAELLNIAKETFKQNRTVFFGRMVTGEKFITDEFRKAINEKYKPLSVDMETTSIAHVCYVNEIGFIAIRSITDTTSHIGIDNFEKNCKQASIRAKEITLQLIDAVSTLYKRG